MFKTLLALLSPAPIARAGYGADNMNFHAHRDSLASVSNYHFHKHRGDASPPIDTLSPSMTQAQMGTVKNKAAQNQNAFNAECSTLLGGWWTALSTGNKETLRDIVNALP